MSYTATVKTRDGVEKTVIASSQEELDEAVKVAKQDQAPVGPDINKPEDGNKEVSPENKQTDPMVSERFTTNQVTQDGKPLPEEQKPDKVEEVSPETPEDPEKSDKSSKNSSTKKK